MGEAICPGAGATAYVAPRSLTANWLFASRWLLTAGVWLAGSPAWPAAPAIEAYLEARVADNPHDATAWRMLGVYQLQQNDLSAARQSLLRSSELDTDSAATHYHLGLCLLQLGDASRAHQHLRAVISLAPATSYAADAAAQLPPGAEVTPVDYQVRQFDGAGRTAALGDSGQAWLAPRRLSVRLDAGALYNSNVTLTPISRSFGASERASAQGFFNPLLEYRLIDSPEWSLGPSFAGYFSVNENDAFGNLNLQSYQPGMFVERVVERDRALLVPRLQYDYTLDQFDGVTFGQRHATTVSLASLWDAGDVSVVYWSSDFTAFADDGDDPSTSSRDGWTHTGGASHQWQLGHRWLRAVTAGADLQWADTTGSDFSYLGGTLYSSLEIPLTESLWCELTGGWGLRDYYESTLDPSRNETIWQASARLTWQATDWLAMAGVFNYDRFNSDNTMFEAERYLTGLVTTIEY